MLGPCPSGQLLRLTHVAAAGIWKELLYTSAESTEESSLSSFTDEERGAQRSQNRLKTTQLVTSSEFKPKSIRLRSFCPLCCPTRQPCSTEGVHRKGRSLQLCLGPLWWPRGIQEISKAPPPAQDEEPPESGGHGRKEGEVPSPGAPDHAASAGTPPTQLSDRNTLSPMTHSKRRL